MGINEICAGNGVTLNPIPSGIAALPEELTISQSEIETLNEIAWILDSVRQLTETGVRVAQVLGERPLTAAGQTALSDATRDVATEVSIPQNEVSFELVLRRAIDLIRSRGGSQTDIVTLQGLLTEVTRVSTPIWQALTTGSATVHSILAAVVSEVYTGAIASTRFDHRSLRYTLMDIINRLSARLSPGVRTAINISQIDWSAPSVAILSQAHQRVMDRIPLSCEAYNQAIPEPPAPIVVEQPVTPPPRPRVFNFGVRVIPAAGFGDGPAAPEMSGEAFCSFRLSDDLTLQAAYRGDAALLSFDNFGVSRSGHDTGVLQMLWRDLAVQATYAYEYLTATDQSQHLGAVGAGYRWFNGLLSPFAGLIAGSSQDDYQLGGYLGVGTSYLYDGRGLARFGVNAQIFGNIVYQDATEEVTYQVGGTGTAFWRPATVAGADFQVGVGVAGGYDGGTESGSASVGLVLGWSYPSSSRIQTFRLGGIH